MNRLGLASFEELEGGGVLRVDGQDPPSPLLPRGRRELAAGDEALLVGEREVDPVLERPERGRQPCEADDRVEDDIRLRAVEELGEVAADLRQRGKALDVLGPGRGGHELELGMGADDLERLRADRPGRSEERDALHAEESRTAPGRGW